VDVLALERLFTEQGKDGIPSDEGAPRTIEYFRASVRETIKTYPLLAGFGITAGESMAEKIGGMTKEQLLWKTYGDGIREGLKDTPNRKFRLIHRFLWLAGRNSPGFPAA
jgi:hypothetical protein